MNPTRIKFTYQWNIRHIQHLIHDFFLLRDVNCIIKVYSISYSKKKNKKFWVRTKLVVFIEMYPYFFIIYLCWMDTWRVLFGCNTAAMKVDSWQSEELKAEKSESETTLNFLWIWITCSATQGGVVDQHYLVSTLFTKQ